MKKLPIGIQSFQKIRADYYYVDKTHYVKFVDKEKE
nr:AAA family ATPase [Calditerrivibrio nitroreducens]